MMMMAALSGALVIALILRAKEFTDLWLFSSLALPYAASGMALATIFRERAAQSPRWYMADLCGAGLGVALVVPAMQWLGVVNGALLAVCSQALAAWFWQRRLWAALVAAALGLLFLANLDRGILTLDWRVLDEAKPLHQAQREGAQELSMRWDAFGRADLIHRKTGLRQLYLDGAAPSIVPAPQDLAQLRQQIGYLPFDSGRPERVFIIGPGGGLDIAYARASGTAEIIAAEVHPASVALLREQEGGAAGLLAAEQVQLRVDEGRSALRRERGEFDLISLSQVVTLAAERGGYALTENVLYTVEAFGEFLDRLTPEGHLALVLYDEATMLRALGLALAALTERGLTEGEALSHLLVAADVRGGSVETPLIVVKNSPWRREELRGPAVFVADHGFQPILFPGVLAAPPLDAVAEGRISFAAATASTGWNLTAPTDDRPFFFQFANGVPRALRDLALVIVAAVGIAALMLLSARGGVARGGGRANRQRLLLYGYVAALGAAFMLLEIAFIQQTRLLLGHPTIAVALVLAAILCFGGLGSVSAERIWRGRALVAAPLALAGLTLVWWLAWEPWSDGLVAGRFPLRAAGTLLALLPLAGLMGMAFPQALRRAGLLGREVVAGCWAVNGVMSVLGTVLALVLATAWGYGSVLWAGAALYGLAGVLGIVSANKALS